MQALVCLPYDLTVAFCDTLKLPFQSDVRLYSFLLSIVIQYWTGFPRNGMCVFDTHLESSFSCLSWALMPTA